MKSPRFARFLAGAFAISVLAPSFSWAQMSVEKVSAINNTLQHVKAAYSKLDARHQRMLDGTANIVHFANVWEKLGMHLADPSFISRAKLVPRESSLTNLTPSTGLVRVSNPFNDVAFSAFGGFTQSETSTARCGNTVVAGFNDSGSVFETPFFFSGTGGQAFSGYAYSSNGGASFTDGGPMNPGPDNGNFLGGDPTVNCSDANTFYYSQIFFPGSIPVAAIAVNKSTDGGKTWGDPVAAIAKNGFHHFLDKPWSTIDPSNPSRIFVSYTDFDFSKTNSCGTNFPGRTAIEFVVSHDGGDTWSTTPKVAIEVCGNGAVQGSQMAVSSKGTMYISWVNLGTNFPLGPRAIQISSFAGGTLTGPVTVDVVQPGGDSFFLQGEFRDFLDMAMAIDHSGTASDGNLYITWADGRDKIVSDPLATQGFYAYDDVLLRASFDKGKTWGFLPTKVNSDNQFSHLVPGRDHYQAGIAVDNRGVVAACWYDRRADVENFAIRRHCGESTNNGVSFSDADIGLTSFAATHGIDIFINPVYMGDYDQMTSDFLNLNSGFIGSFQSMGSRGNPDVVAHPMN